MMPSTPCHTVPRGVSSSHEADDRIKIDAHELSEISKVPQWLRGLGQTSWLLVGFAVLLVGGQASGALAGEVKGPPGTMNNTNETGALMHANSACAASGLNDLDSTSGQNASQVQTAADSWRYYGLPHGAPGKLGLCRGGTGER